MDEQEMSGLLDTIYDAAANFREWAEVGQQLCTRFTAERAYLGVPHADGTLPNLLWASNPFDKYYAGYVHALDPLRASAAAVAHSQYGAEYHQPRGTRHALGARIDTRGQTVLGLFRESRIGPFTIEDLHAVEALLPHLRRGLQLSNVLAAARPKEAMGQFAGPSAGLAALDALPLCVIVTDPGMRVTFANTAAERLTADRNSGLRITRPGPAGAAGPSQLLPSRTKDAAALKKLVAGAAANGPGGALRLRPFHDAELSPQITAVLVSPLPARLAAAQPDGAPAGLADGLAMVVARNLTAAETPAPQVLSELFGLSSSEAAVARLVLGGATAEAVAQTRRVSPDTVRRQIQIVLRKTETANLRDFERVAASLALMQPRPNALAGLASQRVPAM